MDVGSLLSTQYAVVRNILGYLPAKDLMNVSIYVCKMWRDVANMIMKGKSRQRVDYMYYEYRRPVSPSKVVEVVTEEFDTKLKDFVDNELYGDPDVVLALSSGGEGQFLELNKNDECFPYDGFKIIHEAFPKSTGVHIGSSHGVFSPTGELENEYGIIPSFTLLSFPSLPTVGIHPFGINDEVLKKHKIKLHETQRPSFAPPRPKRKKRELIRALAPSLKEEDIVKGILFFASDIAFFEHEKALVEQCEVQSTGRIALGGALVSVAWKSSMECPRPNSLVAQSGVSGLIFSGKDVCAKSIVLKKSVKTEKDVESELSKLNPKEFMGPSILSYAFIFACNARGKAHYNKRPDVESSVFRRLFPETTLVGCFCAGETGADTYMDEVSRIKRNIVYKDCLHSYTTVVFIVSFPKP